MKCKMNIYIFNGSLNEVDVGFVFCDALSHTNWQPIACYWPLQKEYKKSGEKILNYKQKKGKI